MIQSLSNSGSVFTRVVICSILMVTANVAAGSELMIADDSRVWQDSSKSHTINAALVSYASRNLTLKTSDGRTISISIDKVSKPDQVYAMRKIQTARAKLSLSQRQPLKAKSNTRIVRGHKAVRPTLTASTASAEKLYGVNWLPLDQAESVAAKENKPILWLRVLGDMKGFM